MMKLIQKLIYLFVLWPTLGVAANLYFVAPQHGEELASPVTVKFGLKDMGVTAAGFSLEGTGHHHLLIDTDELPDLTKPLPASEKLLHFGKGQTETVLNLSPGTHQLQLILGDHLHVPHQPAVVSLPITITVK